MDVLERLLAPIAWIPPVQEALLAFFVAPATPWLTLAKYVFLLLPALLAVGAVWITLLSVYTLPFRPDRVRFVSLMLLAWWDAARAVWLYWVGILRVVTLATAWIVSLAALTVRLALAALRSLASLPFTLTARLTQTYVEPGVPWIALVMLLGWCVLEATVFTYAMTPTVTGIFSELSGETASRATEPMLFTFLLLLVLGSYAALQALCEAVRAREARFLVHIVALEGVVMFFEVMFLYRELVDAITPWIIRDTGLHIGFWTTLTAASLGWLGTRALTWFLFAQYGTAPLLAVIARRPLPSHAGAPAFARGAGMTSPLWWRLPADDFRRELEWLHAKADQFLEDLALPTLQLLAAGLNFGMMIVASRPAFPLPFRTLRDVMEARDVLAGIP
jgi:hypothetical protein